MPGPVPEITWGSIFKMTALTDKPVFFLHLNHADKPNLVVKGEATGAGVSVSIKWGSKLMKNVNDNRVNMKIMTPEEIRIFKDVALRTFSDPNDPERRNTRYCLMRAQLTWVKMPAVDNLSHAGEVDAKRPEIFRLGYIVTKFRNNSVWDELGKVVAVDMFIGNYDRFSPKGEWVNRGNVMFVADHGEPLKAIGLDPFHPGSNRSDLTAPGHYVDLEILTDPKKRNEFAIACVRSVGQKLMNAFGDEVYFVIPPRLGEARPSRINIEELPDLFVNFVPSFAAGIMVGADDLKRYLQARVAKYRTPIIGRHRDVPGLSQKAIPQGILDRMAYLGW